MPSWPLESINTAMALALPVVCPRRSRPGGQSAERLAPDGDVEGPGRVEIERAPPDGGVQISVGVPEQGQVPKGDVLWACGVGLKGLPAHGRVVAPSAEYPTATFEPPVSTARARQPAMARMS